MLKIKIKNKVPQKNFDGFLFCEIKIYINGQEVDRLLPVEYWDVDKYKKQWIDGIKRIQKKNKSCLMLGVDKQDFEPEEDEYPPTPIIKQIAFYRNKNMITLQELFFCDYAYDKYIGKEDLPSFENYFEYIPNYNKYYPHYYEENIYYEINVHNIKNELSISLTGEQVVIDEETFAIANLFIKNKNYKVQILPKEWCVHDYQRQWKEGIERIQTKDKSCLITQISCCKCHRYIVWKLLYKHNDIVRMYTDSLDMIEYQEELKDVYLTPENCYDFIPPQEAILEKYRVPEWKMSLDDLVNNFEIIEPD